MENKRLLFIFNLSHSRKGLKELANQTDKNVTELFGSSNLPLGVLSIESYVKYQCPQTETRIIDLNTEFMNRLLMGDLDQILNDIAENFDDFLLGCIQSEIEMFKPDIVAISTLFDKSIPTLIELSRMIKAIAPESLIIAGGHPVNNLYEKVLKEESHQIDAVCLGEGEIPFAELLCAADHAAYIDRSSYFVTTEKINNGKTNTLKRIALEDLDNIPPYDYDGFFAKYGDDILCLHNNVLDTAHSFNKQAVIMTSRGCPYNCIFCASKSVHDQVMRKNSLERVKEEIDYWVDQHQVSTIGFIDDHFLFDIDRVIEICDYAGSKGVDIRFPNGLAIAPINQALVDCMVRNQVKEVQLALESGSERVLNEIIRKPLTLKRAEEVFNMFMDTSIFVRIFLVIGFPDEDLSDMETALDFLRNANYHWASISSPTPISGSRLLAESFSKGYIEAYQYDDISFFRNCFENKALSQLMNNDIRYTVNLDINFVHNPYMRMGKFELAKARFESVLKNYPNHGFACYYLIKCLEQLKDTSDEMKQLKLKYNEICEEYAVWRKYADYFGLELVL